MRNCEKVLTIQEEFSAALVPINIWSVGIERFFKPLISGLLLCLFMLRLSSKSHCQTYHHTVDTWAPVQKREHHDV